MFYTFARTRVRGLPHSHIFIVHTVNEKHTYGEVASFELVGLYLHEAQCCFCSCDLQHSCNLFRLCLFVFCRFSQSFAFSVQFEPLRLMLFAICCYVPLRLVWWQSCLHVPCKLFYDHCLVSILDRKADIRRLTLPTECQATQV